jgi:hypothetical protein
LELLLQMWVGQRRLILEKHDFYVEQVKKRVLTQLQDIEGEADRFSEVEYKRLGSLPGDGNSEMDEIAETALDRGHAFYSMLSDLRKRMLLGALAGLYHQWDKELRDFVEHELRHDIDFGTAARYAWDPNVGTVFDALGDFGWNCRSSGFFSKIDACRLIVNVYKHGKGRSLGELAERFPEYLDDSFAEGAVRRLPTDFLDHEWLAISESQFDEIASAFRAFWVEFPERLRLRTQK